MRRYHKTKTKQRSRAKALLTVFVLSAAICTAIGIALRYSPIHPLWQEYEKSSEADTGGTQRRSDIDLTWSEAVAPNYYVEVGRATFATLPDKGKVEYLPLDWIGRAQGVSACIDYNLMEAGSARERDDMSGIHPSGWGNNEEVDIELPTGDVYHGYFWNRSHLLAKSLGGEEIIENLVCATRMQNVGTNLNGSEGGMAYPESLARSWLEAHPNGWLYYAATPQYVGAEPLCRAVEVNLLSSDGTLDLKVVVFNAAKGYTIDYAHGSFAQDADFV